MKRARHVFCDFDGTITTIDGTDAVLEKFALPAWREWEASWESGKISSRECLLQQVELIRAKREDIIRFAAALPIDEGIFELDRRSLAQGIPFSIVSDGLDVIAQTILRRHNLQHIPLYSNQVIWKEDGTLSLEFPYSSPTCLTGAGNCKCALATPSRDAGSHCTYIGDGQSDFCVSKKMDAVYAKGALRRWCDSEAISYTLFETLTQVADSLFSQTGEVL